jgi:hypothetical protein
VDGDVAVALFVVAARGLAVVAAAAIGRPATTDAVPGSSERGRKREGQGEGRHRERHTQIKTDRDRDE